MRWQLTTFLVLAAVTTAAPDSVQAATTAKTTPKADPVDFGEVYPAGTFENLNAGAGGAPSIDLSAVIGRKPVVFCFWQTGFRRSEQVFTELQKLTDELGTARILLYGILPESSAADRATVRARLQELRIHVPVLLDKDYAFSYRLGVLRPPFLSILDGDGRLRLSGGASLRQPLEYKLTVADAIRRVATTGSLGTYGTLPAYYPVVEMVGRKVPDFEAPGIADRKPRRWSSMLDPRRPTVLVFWSVDCPHCRVSLPQINQWMKAHPGDVNMISAAKVTNETMRAKTEEFVRLQGLVFPTLADENLKLGDAFQIISTPTVVIVRPDGVVDSVLTAVDAGFTKTLETKARQLARSQG